jgi:hypothetical protein
LDLLDLLSAEADPLDFSAPEAVLQLELVESTFPTAVDEEEDDELPCLLSSDESAGSDPDFPSPDAVDF